MKKYLLPIFALLSSTAHAAYTPSNPAIVGSCYLRDYDPLFFNKTIPQQGGSYQNWLLDCQKKAIADGATTFASLHRPGCIKAISTGAPFGIDLQTPIVVPRYVCWEPQNSFVRDGTVGSAASNWNGDPSTSALANLYQPMFIFPPTGVMTGDLLINLNRVGSDRGSGVFYGRTWRIKSLTIASGGTGFVGGETCSVANGDPASPSGGAAFTVASATGGAATAITYAPNRWDTQTGQYLLPPFLQNQQWAISNGWDGHDSLHPQVFDNSGNYKTACSGGGANLTVTPTWWPDWCDGTNGCTSSTLYDGIFSNFYSGSGYLHNVYALQSGDSTSASYGSTYGFMADAYDLDVDLIQTGKAHFGTYLLGTDIRVNKINDVGSFVGLKMAIGGSVHVVDYVGDTPTDHYLEIDRMGNFSVNGSFLNFGASPTGTAAIMLGGDTSLSGAGNESHNGTIQVNMENGGKTAGMPAISCAYSRSVKADLTVGNLTGSGSAQSFQNNSFVAYGSNCEKSNLFTGSIDNVSGSLFSGPDLGVGVNIWDATAQAFAGPRGTYEIIGSGVPVNGTTGLNKAGKGSIYRDYTNGTIYENTGTAAATVWTAH